MLTLINNENDPYFNLALEEYLLKEYPLKEDLFFVWRNTSSVVIGRNQNPYNEVDLSYCHKHKIPVLRRISGGGTVYHDLGNVNFTYISNNVKQINNYEVFLHPIIDLLRQMGLTVSFVPKSHIYLGEQKISGNAQASHKHRMLHHGTILYDANLEQARQTLQTKNIKGHHVLSVPASICNIKDKTSVKSNIESFMEYIRSGVLLHPPQDKVLTLQENDLKRIHELANSKFRSFKWTYGINTNFRIQDHIIDLEIENGIIHRSNIGQLEGVKLQYKEVEEALNHFEQKEEILQSIF